MKLADALRGMSSRSLSAYRRASGAPQGETAELVALLTSPERVAQAVETLSPTARLALRILWFQPGPLMSAWAYRTVFERWESGGFGERAIDELVGQALALPPLAAGGQYAIPDEIRPVLGETAYAGWLEGSGALGPAAGPAEVHAPTAPLSVVADLARLLGAVEAAPPRLRRQDGAPYQADQQRLCAAMDRAAQPTLPPPGPTAPTWEGYDPALAPLIAAGAALGLLAVHDGAWRPTARCQDWTDRPSGLQWRGLVRAWTALWPDQPEPLARVCHIVLGCLRTGVWCRPAALATWVARHMPDNPASVADAAHNLLVRTGVRVGALEWGWADGDRDDPPGCAVRICPPALAAMDGGPLDDWPSAEPPLVQGTFQVLAGPRVPPTTFRLLELWAERESLDRFATYRLTQGSVRAAAARGCTPHPLLGALAASPGGVPQNVAYTLTEWARPASRLLAELGVVVRPAHPGADDTAELGSILAGAIRLGPTAWLLSADMLPDAWATLERAGYQLSGDLADLMARLRPRPEPGGGMRAAPIPLPWPGVPAPVPWPEEG